MKRAAIVALVLLAVCLSGCGQAVEETQYEIASYEAYTDELEGEITKYKAEVARLQKEKEDVEAQNLELQRKLQEELLKVKGAPEEVNKAPKVSLPASTDPPDSGSCPETDHCEECH